MPIKEAFFWVSIAVFGTGLYFLPEHKGLAVVLIALGLIGVVYSVVIHHMPNMKQPPLWLALLFLTWGAVAYDYYDRNNIDLLMPEDTGENETETYYGGVPGLGLPYCRVTANGNRFLSFQKHYKLAAGCFVWDGLGDVEDAPQLQVSSAVDIRKGEIPITLRWGASFEKRMLALPGGGSINYVLLMLPIGVDPGQFTTLRQAHSMGVRVVFRGSAGAVIGTHYPPQ